MKKQIEIINDDKEWKAFISFARRQQPFKSFPDFESCYFWLSRDDIVFLEYSKRIDIVKIEEQYNELRKKFKQTEIYQKIKEKLDKTKKEKIGWMILAEKSLNKMWDNKKDEEVWAKYL